MPLTESAETFVSKFYSPSQRPVKLLEGFRFRLDPLSTGTGVDVYVTQTKRDPFAHEDEVRGWINLDSPDEHAQMILIRKARACFNLFCLIVNNTVVLEVNLVRRRGLSIQTSYSS